MAASSEFEFSGACVVFQNVVKQAAENTNTEECFSFVKDFAGNEQEKKAALDQAMREVLRNMIVFDQGCAEYKKQIGMAIEAVVKELCSASTPFLMLADVFDMMVLDDCQDMFDFVEDRVLTWKSEPFFDAGKNYLLRMCNDLIRRLSKSQNTVFCGRIQLFLSRLFPLSEKSALNLMSQFNLENITVFASKSDAQPSEPAAKQEKMEVEGEEGEKKPSGLLIDYNLYRKFWSLQDYFRRPVQCYDKAAWRAFIMYSDEVLFAFSSCKLDDLLSQRKNLVKQDHHTKNFFAKYLTSEKLLDLQLSDSNFRRYVLVQFLILFQYLTLTVRFKGATQTLTEEQTTWVKASEEKVYQLIRETPPAGDKFADIVKHVLSREEHWNTWKNDSCPSYERAKVKDTFKPKARPRRRRIGEDLQAGGKVVKMGSAELTRLWNLNPDNLEACRSDERQFTPRMEEYFINAIEQSDPEAMIEEQYKDINSQQFQWRALRLLAEQAPHFFTNSCQPAIPLPKYLDNMISKIAKEMPTGVEEEQMKTQVGEEEEDDMKEGQDEAEATEDTTQSRDEVREVISDDQMKQVAEALGDAWKKLAQELQFSGEDIADFEAVATDAGELPGAKMIFIWQDSDPENTAPVLRDALKEVGQLAIAENVFGFNS